MKLKSTLLIAAILMMASAQVLAQCTPRVLPFTETFSGFPFAACGWDTTGAASGAGWWLPATNYAGGSVPEAEAYGDQANGGVPETIRLISPALDITGVASISVSFMHNLYLTNSAASGSQSINVGLESSTDSISWSNQYSAYYNATSSLTSVVMETRHLNVGSLSTNKIYLRFYITGVLFKVWGWEIDNVNVTPVTFTHVPSLSLNERMVFYDAENAKLIFTTTTAGHVSAAICDILGNTVFQSQSISDGQSVDVSRWKKGVYFLRMQNTSGSLTKKIVLN